MKDLIKSALKTAAVWGLDLYRDQTLSKLWCYCTDQCNRLKEGAVQLIDDAIKAGSMSLRGLFGLLIVTIAIAAGLFIFIPVGIILFCEPESLRSAGLSIAGIGLIYVIVGGGAVMHFTSEKYLREKVHSQIAASKKNVSSSQQNDESES